MKNKGNEALKPSSTTGYDANEYTTEGNWEAMESAGAVFLPAAGCRNDGFSVFNIGTAGWYWSSSPHDGNSALRFYLCQKEAYTDGWNYRYWGCCVRLVTDVK